MICLGTALPQREGPALTDLSGGKVCFVSDSVIGLWAGPVVYWAGEENGVSEGAVSVGLLWGGGSSPGEARNFVGVVGAGAQSVKSQWGSVGVGDLYRGERVNSLEGKLIGTGLGGNNQIGDFREVPVWGGGRTERRFGRGVQDPDGIFHVRFRSCWSGLAFRAQFLLRTKRAIIVGRARFVSSAFGMHRSNQQVEAGYKLQSGGCQ